MKKKTSTSKMRSFLYFVQVMRISCLTKLALIIFIVATVHNCFLLTSSEEPTPSQASLLTEELSNFNDIFSATFTNGPLPSPEYQFSYLAEYSPVPESDSIEEEFLFESSQYGEEIPRIVYLHFSEPTGNISDFSWIPEVVFEKISEDDIPVDLGLSLENNDVLEVSDTIRNYIYLTTTREARGEPFLGQLAVAEDILNRLKFPDIYGSNIIDIIAKGYGVEKDSNGILHFYDGNGQEMLNPTESCKEAVDFALSGSDITSVLLEAVTALQNERYGLSLGSEYYQNGATFHFAPKYISNGAIDARRFQRVPVGFRIDNHIFYGYWHTSEDALDITIEY